MTTSKRDLDFLFEIGSLRNIQRGWRQHLGMDCATVLEHTLRVVWLALIIARKEGASVDENKIIRMALVHDLAEARVSDLSYVQKVYTKGDEQRASEEMFAGTSLADFNKPILHDYENRASLEAKIVKDADNLDVDLEMKELEEKGSQLPKKWAEMRALVRNEKLYTNAAKALWDELQTMDVADWHLKSNKWVRIPEAGR